MFRLALSRAAAPKAVAASATKMQARNIICYMNKAILLGNVGADPQEHTFANGAKIASFSLATSRRYKDGTGNIIEQTSWHKIKFSGDQADKVMRIVKKSAYVQVDGTIRYDTFTNKDGVEVHTTTIQGETIRIIAFPKRPEGEEPKEDADAEVGSRATEKLSDAESDEFSRFQKVHQAHVEYLPLAQSSVLLAGLFYPKLSAYAGAAYIVGRFIYSFGYIRAGPDARKWGVCLICPSIVTLLGASFYGSFKALALV
ncbi:hypothetical protein GGI20_005008 [Coemansia sp. BCRC 34301]|nr:hypothetical protein GGI20_005008 [Coemansia sp. BCRC 34301]